MNILYKKAKIDLPRLKKYAVSITGTELSKLTEPCYYPSLKKHYFELLDACGLTDGDLKEFRTRFYAGMGAKAGMLVKDPQTNLLIFILFIALKNRNQILFQAMMTYIGIRYYTNLMYRQIRFCNVDAFKYALEHLTKTHLFSREKTIPNSIIFLSNEMTKRYTSAIRIADPDIVSDFILEYRHRLSQSIRSFAEIYYEAAKEGIGIKKPYEYPEEEGKEAGYEIPVDRATKVIDDIVKKITVYKIVDKPAADEAKSLTKASTNLATLISTVITDLKYSDDIRIVLQAYLKNISSVDQVCGKGYYDYIRKLMAIKRIGNKVSFKQAISDMILKIMDDLNLRIRYDKFTGQTKFTINSYLAFYITLVLRHTLC